MKILRKFGFDENIINWIKIMLRTRTLAATRDNAEITGFVNTERPQGGILLPLLWCLVVDSLLFILEKIGVIISAYAEVIIFLISSMDPGRAERIAQRALDIIRRWCDRIGLSVNPDKMEFILFTKKINKPCMIFNYNQKEINFWNGN